MSTPPVPVYFELSWSILSTIGLANVLFGVLVVGITSFSPVATVPIATSAAGAVANGLCYYAFYADPGSLKNQAVASAFADMLWMFQEAGLSFYSYVILNRVLRDRQWYTFCSLFWLIIAGIVGLRLTIAITRVRLILDDKMDNQTRINRLHTGYFVSIALLECVSAFYLLQVFASAKTTSLKAAIKTGLFRYLMRSTEVRLALLAVLGVIRAITYSFQNSKQSATNVPSQVDRFAYTLECLFPIVMYIDILASKLVFTSQGYASSSRSRQQQQQQQNARSYPRNYLSRKGDLVLSTMQGENVVHVHGGKPGGDRASSQERIIDRDHSRGPSDIDLDEMDPKRIGISKTVEFEVYESEDPNREFDGR